MLEIIFWTCVVLACAYSIYMKKVGPALVVGTSVVAYYLVRNTEKQHTTKQAKEEEKANEAKRVAMEQQASAQRKQNLENERLEERTRELEMEEQIQNYFMRPSIDESRYTEPIEAREALVKGMSLPDHDKYTRYVGEQEKFTQYA